MFCFDRKNSLRSKFSLEEILKIILQHDQRDCGAACLAMISSHFGARYPIARIREWTKTDRNGTNLYGLIDGAQKIGLSANALSGTMDELTAGISDGEIRLPFIAHIISEDALLHYVVVYAVKNGTFFIADPGKGKYTRSSEEFAMQWTGYILTFEKSEEFRPGNYAKGSLRNFFGLLKGQYVKLGGVWAISLIITVISIMSAYVFELVIDHFSTETGYYSTETEAADEEAHDHEHDEAEKEDWMDHLVHLIRQKGFYWILVFIIVLYVIQALIQYIRGCLIISVSRKIDLRLTMSYYNHIAGLPVSSIAVRQTGEYLSRFSDASCIRNAISGAALTLMLDSVMVVFCGIILYLEIRNLFFLTLLIILLYAIIVGFYRKPIENTNRALMENNARVQSYLKESIDGIETVKASNAEEAVKEQTNRKFHDFLNSIVKSSRISMAQDVVVDLVEGIGTMCVLCLGFVMVLNNQATMGSLMTFYVLINVFTDPIKNLIELQPTIQTALVAADRLNDILELEQEDCENHGETMPEIREWELRNVDFRYGNQNLTLEGIDLSLHRGEKIAIVGESGSGKTTLVKLLMRFYEPEAGQILLDGQPIEAYSLHAVRQSIAYVDQNTFLFSDTIRNNLRLGNPNISEEEMKKACAVCQADTFIEKLPFGYDTPLEENASNLSGGQKQRLSIVRALLKHPQLLILDEASSHLDTVTEAGIHQMIENWQDDLTCIIIAHRLSTVKNCDRIYVMKDGKITECGTHQTLLDSNGDYADFWKHME